MENNKNNDSSQHSDSKSTDSINKVYFNPFNPLESEGRRKRSQQEAEQRIISLAPQSKMNSRVSLKNNPDGTIMEENY